MKYSKVTRKKMMIFKVNIIYVYTYTVKIIYFGV